MANKYHITKDGQIMPCTKFIRSCPLTDYGSEEAAARALYEMKQLEEHERKVSELRRIVYDYDHIVFLNADVSGNLNDKQTRKLVKKIEEAYHVNKTPLMKMISSNPLILTNSDDYSRSFTLKLDSIPKLLEEDEVIINHWSLEYNLTGSDKQVYSLDLMNDRENAMLRAEAVVREALIQNSRSNLDVKTLTYDTNEILNQIDDIHTMFDEEISGPSYSWEKNPKHGTFGCSYSDTIRVDVNYNTSLFRGRTFERFVRDSYFQYIDPSFHDVQVYDNENGESDSSWRLVWFEENWYLQTVVDNGEPVVNKIESTDQLHEYMYNFVRNKMRTNSVAAAEEKAEYGYDLMKTINNLYC